MVDRVDNKEDRYITLRWVYNLRKVNEWENKFSHLQESKDEIEKSNKEGVYVKNETNDEKIYMNGNIIQRDVGIQPKKRKRLMLQFPF